MDYQYSDKMLYVPNGKGRSYLSSASYPVLKWCLSLGLDT